jgi:hypothetical protein
MPCERVVSYIIFAGATKIAPVQRFRLAELPARALSNHLKMIRFFVMAGHSRPKDGVASARLCPAIHAFLARARKTWMPGTADKFTQSAQGRLLWPGMTSFHRLHFA